MLRPAVLRQYGIELDNLFSNAFAFLFSNTPKATDTLGIAQMVKCLPSVHGTLGPTPSTDKH